MIFLVKFPGLSSALISAKNKSWLMTKLGDVAQMCEITEWDEPLWIEFIPPELYISELGNAGDLTQITFLEESLDKFFELAKVTNGVLPSANPEARNESVMRREIMKQHYPHIAEVIDSRTKDRDKLKRAIQKDIHFPSDNPRDPYVRFRPPASAAGCGLSEAMLEKADQYYKERVEDGEGEDMKREAEAFEGRIGAGEKKLEDSYREADQRTKPGPSLFGDIIKDPSKIVSN